MGTKDKIKNQKDILNGSDNCETMLKSIFQSMPIPQFVIDKNHIIISWNKALEKYSGIKADDIIGTKNQWQAFYQNERPCLADFLIDGKIDETVKWYPDGSLKSALINDAYESTGFFPDMGESGIWLHFTAALIKDKIGNITGAVETLEDITEKKNAEIELTKSQAHFRQLVENINDVIFTMDLTGIITYISPVIKNRYGYRPKEVEGHHFSEFVHPDDLKKAREGFRDRIKGKYTVNIFRIMTKEGEERYVRTTQTPIEDGKNILGFNYVMTDITEQCLAQQALYASEEKFRGVAERSSDIIMITDDRGRIIYIAPSVKEILGYEPDEITGAAPVDFVHPEDLETVKTHYREEMRNQENGDKFEARIRKKDGEYAIIEFSGSTVLKNGIISGVQVIGRDITARKRAEEAVKTAVTLNQIIDKMSAEEAMSFTIDEAERLTSSKIGFFHLVNPDEQTIELVTWSTLTKSNYFVQKEPERKHPVSKAGVWVDCIRERKIVIHNNYENLTQKKGLPKGHIPVAREITVPIFDEDKIVGIIGVGNKSSDYIQNDADILTLLAKNAWTLIRRKHVEEALKNSEYRFRELFNSMKSGVAVYKAVDDGADFVFIDFNHGAELIENVSRKDVIGRKVRDVFPSVEEFGLFDIYKKVWQTGNPEQHPVSLYKDNRLESWRENYIYRLPSGEIVAIYEDLTREKLAEEALWKSEEKSLYYIKEAAMRLKTPIEVITENISATILELKSGDFKPDEIILELKLQMKNLDQTKQNITDLNKTIVESYEKISPASKKFLTE
ncbi:MAG: PAS domain S-box protein [Methanomicrobium sp.]|nr:PAS domain S-box protein [Methanomicrobium sp.]